MVKERKHFWLRKVAVQEKYNTLIKLQKILIVCVCCMFTQAVLSQSEDEPALYGETRTHHLKYLRSISAFEQNDEDEINKIVYKFAIDLKSGVEAKITCDTWVKSEPSSRANNINTFIPSGTLLKVYKNADNPMFYAVKFRNKWGFINENSVSLLKGKM
jgi:hypothetical protein